MVPRRTVDQARTLLLAATCGEPSDAPALWKHAAEDRDAGGTGRIVARAGGFQIGCEETGAWRVSLEMGRKRSGAGFRRGRSDGTGRFRGPASAKTKETPRPLVLGRRWTIGILIRGGKTEIPVDQACQVPLVAAGGELPHTVAVHRYAAENHDAASTDGIAGEQYVKNRLQKQWIRPTGWSKD
jgi:hypothetical protein